MNAALPLFVKPGVSLATRGAPAFRAKEKAATLEHGDRGHARRGLRLEERRRTRLERAVAVLSRELKRAGGMLSRAGKIVTCRDAFGPPIASGFPQRHAVGGSVALDDATKRNLW